MRTLVCRFLCLGAAALVTAACTTMAPRADNDAARVRSFLQEYDRRNGTDASASFFAAKTPLCGNDLGYVVLLTGRYCGTAGCTILLLRPDGATFQVIGDVATVTPDVRILASSTNGCRDIAVWIRAVMAQPVIPGYERVITYDGKTYPHFPTEPGTRRATKDDAGAAVITRADMDRTVPLYPVGATTR